MTNNENIKTNEEEVTDVTVVDEPSFMQKVKTTATTIWNSKPMQIGKKVALVGVGILAGLALSKAASNNSSDETDFEWNEIEDLTEDYSNEENEES